MRSTFHSNNRQFYFGWGGKLARLPFPLSVNSIRVNRIISTVMRGSILPVTIPPRAHPRAFVYLTSYSPPPGTQKETIPQPPGPMTWTKNKLLRFDDLFLYLNKTRNLKNPKLLEQLTPFRSKANIIKLDTHTHQEGVSTKLPRKLKCISTKQLLNS